MLLALLALLAFATGCGDDKDGSKPAAAATSETTGDTTADEEIPSCDPVEMPSPKSTTNLKKPKLTLDPAQEWTATVATNCGTFTITLDVARAPKTAASFASLAKKGFYDDLTFHRIAPGFVIQGGDPLGNGTGGPGYRVVEAPPNDLAYTHGIVAMAKTGTEPDGASGSQFFVVLGEDVGLPPQYALVGEVTSGLEIVDKIGAVQLESADPQGSPPLDPVVIESVEIAGS